MLLTFTFLIPASVGITSHLLYFIRGEHHEQAPRTFRIFGLLALSIFSGLVATGYWGQSAFVTTCLLFISYAFGIFSSMLTYRIFFHPLKNFTGPPMAKVSKLWHVSKTVKAKNYLLMQQMHAKYGDFVPMKLQSSKLKLCLLLNAPGTRCSKAPWYDLLLPRISVATTRNKELHDKRRRVWDYGFSMFALQEYEARLSEYAHLLERKIVHANRNAIEVSKLFYLYSFDVMGRLAFGKNLDMLTESNNHFAMDLLQSGMAFLSPFSSVPWLVRIGYSLPGVAMGWKRLLKWSREQVNERLKAPAVGESRDLTSWLLDASHKGNDLATDGNWIAGDAFAIVIAGSDTVASTLTYLFYHLCLDPSQVRKIRAKLSTVESLLHSAALQKLPYLNATISETLRLHPALPTGGLRDTPPEDITISGVFIPGNVTVSAPRYILGRLEESYERPHEFIPERWYSWPDLVKDKSGFSPFSMGRHNCVGKRLSLMQLRGVIALLVMKYDICFAPGEDGTAACRDMKDQFNQHPGKLEISFTAREGV